MAICRATPCRAALHRFLLGPREMSLIFSGARARAARRLGRLPSARRQLADDVGSYLEKLSISDQTSQSSISNSSRGGSFAARRDIRRMPTANAEQVQLLYSTPTVSFAANFHCRSEIHPSPPTPSLHHPMHWSHFRFDTGRNLRGILILLS